MRTTAMAIAEGAMDVATALVDAGVDARTHVAGVNGR